MRKFLTVVVAAFLLAGCSETVDQSALDSSPSAMATDMPSVVASESAVATPLPSESVPALPEPAKVTVGPATVSGPLDREPKVKVNSKKAATDKLIVKDAVVGEGDVVAANAMVTAHYVGYGATSGLKFDGSWDRGQPAQFPLEQVISGWSEGLPGMKVGGRRILIIPGSMGYGDSPPEGSGILPGETLIFVVDMIATQ